jgi:hypothetical protein
MGEISKRIEETTKEGEEAPSIWENQKKIDHYIKKYNDPNNGLKSSKVYNWRWRLILNIIEVTVLVNNYRKKYITLRVSDQMFEYLSGENKALYCDILEAELKRIFNKTNPQTTLSLKELK